MTLRAEVERRTPATRMLDWVDWMENEFGHVAGLRLPTLERSMRCEDFMDADRYVLRAEVAGMDPDKDLHVDVADGVLTISAERSEEKKDGGRSEFFYGTMRRSVTLPAGADPSAVTASYRNGILEISVPIKAGGPTTTSVAIERTP
jgi:HSP20 family molecular chaperone IbpA